MAQSGIIKARGLDTFNNSLDLGDQGFLQQADNVNIDRNDIIEPRRGFKQYLPLESDSTSITEQLLVYKDKLIVHYPKSVNGVSQGNKLAFENTAGTAFTDFNGNFDEVDTGVRLKAVEMNGNLYFTSSTGIKKISENSASNIANDSIVDAGAPKALGVTLTLDLSQTGFLTGGYRVGYRVVWSITDANNNLIIGYPSPFMEIENISSESGVVKVRFAPPEEATSSYKYQIYRTQILPVSNTLEDELKLVYEGSNDSSTNYSGGYYEITDIYSEDLRQSNTNLYTNITSGETIAKANEKPPIAQDLTVYKNYMFMANTKSKESLSNTLLGLSEFKAFGVSSVSLPTTTTVRLTFASAHLVNNGDSFAIFGLIPNTGTQVSGIKTATNVTANTIDFTVTTPLSSISMILGGAQIYKTYIKTTKNLVNNKYWAIGRRHISSFNLDNRLPGVTITAAPSTFTTSANHNFENDLQIQFTNVTGLTGVSLNTTYYIVNKTNNTFQIAATAGGSVITFTGTSSSITLVYDYKTYLDDEYISLYSADDKVRYIIWFDSVGTALTPPYSTPSGASLIKIDTSSANFLDTITEVIVEALNNQLFDFESYLDPSSPRTIVIETASSGECTDATVVSPSGTINIIYGSGSSFTTQKGVGLITSDDYELTNDKYIIFSTYTSPASRNAETTNSLINAINQNTSETIYGFYTSSISGLPGEFGLESRTLDGYSFTISASTTEVETINFNIPLPQTSASETNPNRMYYSKQFQPDAVPISNYFDVGPKDKPIRRIVGLRDSLYIFKDEGIYKLQGETDGQFTVALFDSSSNITANDSVAIVNNQIYLLTSQGVARVSDSGVEIISRPIENKFNLVQLNSNFKTISFGIGYEADRCYILFVPDNSTDEIATRAYRFSTFTESWTSWTKSYQCGVVNPSQNKLYFGSGSDYYVEVERKTLSRKDYSDRYITGKQFISKINSTTIVLSSVSSLEKGDAVVQEQKLTIAHFNQLINKLNIDISLTGINAVEAVTGESLANKLSELVVLLNTYDTTPVTPYSSSGLNDATSLQNDFNTIVNKLNGSSGVFFTNYTLSSGTIEIEAHIKAINSTTNRITTDSMPPFIKGDIIVEKGIKANVVYHAMTFGDPISWKHVREGRLLFESTNFEGGTIGYNTDLTNNFEDLDFTLEGNGSWGNSTWNEFTWGGEGQQTPVRTLIPRQKQRSRMIRTRFKHQSARDKFAIYGLFYIYETTGERAYGKN